MSKFSYTIIKRGDESVYYLSGKIDEDFRQKDIDVSNSSKIVFNFKDVLMINSCGVREWIGLLKTIPSNIELAYEECKPIIVTQMNIIAGFVIPGMRVISFYAPYFDPSDESETMHLIKTSELTSIPPVLKNKNGETLDFDAHPEKYFHFLKMIRK